MKDDHSVPKTAFSIKELERSIGICHSTAYQLIQNGELRTFTIGRRRFVSADALREFVAKRENQAA